MSKIVVIGIPGEKGLYMADLEVGTIVAFDPPATGALAAANDLRKAGGTVVKGIDFAVAIHSTEAAFSGVFDG
ncbi:hypothetical protein ASG19_07185 [Rhizobium sp. Leaf306]|uniref:hypothetical protein n=1 Tax=Rhizobium sp. Leaf306 TaxID=1736330 RepID=UPI00071541F4|nr:hypothetical protein [Rhizobium sp. Leaf306]KQQ39043.1 hypothetical protein ASG19_07185 [Rhizobium sp. Leaf306]